MNVVDLNATKRDLTPLLNQDSAVLVTGGAGYIGSHVVRQLRERQIPVVVLDNLSTGFREAVFDAELIVGDTTDGPLIEKIIREHGIQAVMHFAAKIVVPESVADPIKYYANNTCASLNLLRCCQAQGVEHFIFSSTAAVYGETEQGLITEDALPQPANPYGMSKLMTEQIIRDIARAGSLRYVILRYFNVAGADPGGRIGQSTPGATHLIKVACQTALGQRPSVAIFGTDYPTPDGTGIRDYIHVEDLADAHLKALAHLQNKGESLTLNCGYGQGYSVREVLKAVENLSGSHLNIIEQPRRAGDVASVVAGAQRIRDTLHWQPQHNDLDHIVQSALSWERMLAQHPEHS